MEPLWSCLHLRGGGFIYHSEFPSACGARSGAICLGCLACGTSNANINPLIHCTNISHQHSISGRLNGSFSNSSPHSANKHFFSEFYSGATWVVYKPACSLTEGNQFCPRSVFAPAGEWSWRWSALHSPTLTRLYQLELSQPALIFQPPRGLMSSSWLLLLHLIPLSSRCYKPRRRDAELGGQSGHWDLCSVARPGPTPGLLLVTASVSIRDREAVNSEFGYWTDESPLLHTDMAPLSKNSLIFISCNVYTFRRSDVVPCKRRWEHASKPTGWWLCSQLMQVCGQGLPSTAEILLRSAKADGSLNLGEYWLLWLGSVHTWASPYSLLILVRHKDGFSVGSAWWGVVFVPRRSVDESVLHVHIFCHNCGPSAGWSSSPSGTQIARGIINALQRASYSGEWQTRAMGLQWQHNKWQQSHINIYWHTTGGKSYCHSRAEQRQDPQCWKPGEAAQPWIHKMVLGQTRLLEGMGGGQQPSFFWPVHTVVLKRCSVE